MKILEILLTGVFTLVAFFLIRLFYKWLYSHGKARATWIAAGILASVIAVLAYLILR